MKVSAWCRGRLISRGIFLKNLHTFHHLKTKAGHSPCAGKHSACDASFHNYTVLYDGSAGKGSQTSVGCSAYISQDRPSDSVMANDPASYIFPQHLLQAVPLPPLFHATNSSPRFAHKETSSTHRTCTLDQDWQSSLLCKREEWGMAN